MKRALIVAFLIVVAAATVAAAQEEPPISPAQLQKILKFVDTIGAKQEFPPPTALNLGISNDPNQVLPVVVVVTNDHKVYFCRSELNRADFIIWTRTTDANSSYMFLTHADFALIRALHLRNEGFPEVLNKPSSQIQTMYRNALIALAKDVDSSPAH